MAVEKDIGLNIIAKLDRFKRDMMTKMPEISAKATRAAAKIMAKEWNAGMGAQIRIQKQGLKQITRMYQDAFRLLGVATTALAFKSVIQGIADTQQQIADLVNDVNDLSAATGFGAESLAAYGFAAETSGGNLAELTPSLKQFPKRLADFARGTGEARFALEQLGFTSKDAKRGLKDLEGVSAEIIRRIQEVPDVGQRAAHAIQIFGESGTRLIQVLAGGELEEWVDIAERWGTDVGPAASAAARDWQVQITLLNGAITRIKTDLIAVTGGLGGAISFIGGEIVFLGAAFTGLVEDTIRQFGVLGGVLSAVASRDINAINVAVSRLSDTWADNRDSGREIMLNALKMAKVFRDDLAKALDLVANGSDMTARSLALTSEELKKSNNAAKDFVKTLDDMIKAEDQLLSAVQAAESDKRSARHEAVLQSEANIATIQSLLDKELLSHAAAANGIRAIRERLGRDLVQIDKDAFEEMLETHKAAAAADRDALDQATEYSREQAMMLAEIAIDSANQVGELINQQFEMRADKAEATAQRMVDAQKKRRDQIKKLEDELLKADTQREKNKIKNRLATLQAVEKFERKKTRAARRAAIDAAKAQRKAAVFTIAVQTIVAGIMAIAQLGPIAGAIAAVGVAAAGTAAGIAAANQPLPSFYRGGVRLGGGSTPPGETMARLHSGEAVLNSAATRGNEDVIDALNGGFLSLRDAVGQNGGGDVYLGTERVGRVMAEEVGRAGPLRDSVQGAMVTGRRNIWST